MSHQCKYGSNELIEMFEKYVSQTQESVEFFGRSYTAVELLELMPGLYEEEFCQWEEANFDKLYTCCDIHDYSDRPRYIGL